MENKKISNLNDDFDLSLFLKIVQRNIPWIIIFFVIAFMFAFLYLRYTYPIFEAKSVIQIASNSDEARKLIKNNQSDIKLGAKIELLKSPNFLSRVFNKLPLDINYYQIGNVLNFEMYKTSPFEIEYKYPKSDIYGTPINISFVDENNAKLVISQNNIEREYKVQLGKWNSLPIIDSIKINVNNFSKIKYDQKGKNENAYFFSISNKDNLVRLYSPLVKVDIESEEANTIRIIVHDKNASKASDICNNIVNEFKQYDIEKQAEGINKTLTFIDDQLRIMEDKLYSSENDLQNFRVSNNVDENLPLPDFVLRLNNLKNDETQIDLNLSILDQIANKLNENKEMDVFKLVPLTLVFADQPGLQNQLKKLETLLLKKEEELYSKTPNNTSIIQLDSQIDFQKDIVIESIKAIKSGFNTKKIQIQNKLEEFDYDVRNSGLKFDKIEMTRLMKLNEINQDYYTKLISLKSQLAIDNAGITSENTVLQNSFVPGSPFFPSKKVVVFSALTAWFVLSLILIIVRYLFYNEITSMNEITKFLGDTPILGIVPNYKDVIPVSQLLVDKKPKSLIAESLRSIRSNLEFLSDKPGPKVLAITSTISGEGKTFVAMNLAGIIAFSEKKVIIIDLDMRKPKIHVGFGVSNDKGMSTILIKRNTISECIYRSSLTNLDFITAGPVPPNPSELVISQKMIEVIEELKKTYDIIVIDNPPVGLVTDGIKMLKIADYPIYVFRENYSKRNFVQNVKKLMRDHQVKNLSIIMNSVNIKKSGYGYSGIYDYDYGYGYGYGFGYYDEDFRREKFTLREFIKNLINK
jgi:capsular exopolysaccharide synthesis family protein